MDCYQAKKGDTAVLQFMRQVIMMRSDWSEQIMIEEKEKVASPRVATMLKRRLDELQMTRSDFIRKFDRETEGGASRNHLFKILNGQAIAGERGLLPLIVKSLDLDLDEVIRAVRADKIQAKNWAQAVPKANKIQLEVVTLMDGMSKRDQEEILRYAKMRAGQ
jgi:hypothetical protein